MNIKSNGRIKLLCCLILFAVTNLVRAQDFFHSNATNSYTWSSDGFDCDYKEVTVPLTDSDPTHTFTKLQHWRIPFDQIASVDFANTGSANDVTVAVMLKSEITYQDTESSYHGDENTYSDHSLACYVRFFKTQGDGLNFINYIKQHLGNGQSDSANSQAESSANAQDVDSIRDDTSWAGKKIYTENGYHAHGVVLDGQNICIYHYYYSQPASETVPGVPADPYDYEVVPLKNIVSVQVSQNNSSEVLLNLSGPVYSYYYYATGKNRGDFEKVSVSNYSIDFSTAEDAQHFRAYLNHHSSSDGSAVRGESQNNDSQSSTASSPIPSTELSKQNGSDEANNSAWWERFFSKTTNQESPDAKHNNFTTLNADQSDALSGVTFTDLDSDTRSQLRIPNDVLGTLVIDVARDSHAADASLQRGDVIMAIDNCSARNINEAVRLANDAKGDYVLLKIWRREEDVVDGARYFTYFNVDNRKAR